MLKLIARRLALGVLTLLAVSVLIFVCTQILPGDVASAVLGQQATPETEGVFRRSSASTGPPMCATSTGCSASCAATSGARCANKRDILDEIAPRFGNTLFLAGYAALIAVPLAVVLGILAAIREELARPRHQLSLTLIDDLDAGVLHRPTS